MVETKIEKEVTNCTEIANRFEINDNPNYEKASDFLKSIKGLMKKVDESFDDSIKKAHEAHKSIIAAKKKHTIPLLDAEKILKQKISKYLYICEQKRLEEQRRLEEIERKKQEEEALKQAALADNEEEAEEIMQEAIENKPVIIAPKIETKIEGISSRDVSKWKLIDIKKVNPEFLMLNEKSINAIVRSLGKNAESVIGGIQVYTEKIISARS